MKKDKLKNKTYEDVRRALFQLPRQEAGQMKELADAVGINYDRLRRATSDVETTREGRDISLIEALKLMEAADDYGILFAICSELGFETPRILEPTDMPKKISCSQLMEGTLAIAASTGELSGIIKDAVADNRISEIERRDMLEAVEKAQKDLEKIRHMIIKAS